MARDWSREAWFKVYGREDGAWLALSWQARGLYRLLQTEAGRDGVIEVGKRGSRWVAVVFRMTDEEAKHLCDELWGEGYIVDREDGSWLLPHHADQQATVSSSADRVKRHRERSRVTGNEDAVTHETDETLHVTPVTLHPLHVTEPAVTVTTSPVTVKRKEREEREEREERQESSRGRARVAESKPAAAAPRVIDPKARRIALELAAHPKFASLDHAAVADELLGALGPLGFGLGDERIEQAVAQAAAEAETGAPERRLRQVLGWKLKDAVTGGRKLAQMPQGVDAQLAEDVARIRAQAAEEQAARDAARANAPELADDAF